MANKKRPMVPARMLGETENAYLARIKRIARAQLHATVSKGRPSTAALIFSAAHLATLRWAKHSVDSPSQQQIRNDTRDILTVVRENPDCAREFSHWWKGEDGWAVPSAPTIRKHVRCFLRWRRGMTDEELERLPNDQRLALRVNLYPDMQKHCVIGEIGATEGIAVQGDDFIYAAIAVTRQIKSIKSLR